MLDRKIGAATGVQIPEVLLRDGRFETVLGTGGKLFLLCDGDELVSFVPLPHQDCIADIRPFPGWFVFTAPEYRGHRYSEQIISHACEEARRQGHEKVYLATDHIGFYENTDLFIWKTGRIRAVRMSGFILNHSPDSCTPFIQRSLMQSAPKALACYLPVSSGKTLLYTKAAPRAALLLSVRTEIPISRILFLLFLSLPQLRHRPFSSPHSGCRRKLRRIF